MLGERPSILGLYRAMLALSISIVGFSGCLGPNAFKFQRTSASSFMRTIEESNDPNARYAAYDKLASLRTYENDDQKNRAAQLLAVKLKNGHEPNASRAIMCRTLGMLGKPVAREVILAATSDEDPLVKAEACRTLGRVGRPEDATILARIVIIDPSVECKVAAIESLGELKSTDPRINDLLVAGMEDREPAVRVACLHALRAITGKDLGVDHVAWKKYFEAASPKPAIEPPSTNTTQGPAPFPPVAPGLPPLLPELPPEIP
jgi:hypothetical protein